MRGDDDHGYTSRYSSEARTEGDVKPTGSEPPLMTSFLNDTNWNKYSVLENPYRKVGGGGGRG